MKSLTNKVIDERLLGRNIKRLDDYPNNGRINIHYQCLICNYGLNNEWNARTANILSGFGCPNCAQNIKFDNNIVDKKLEKLNIKRLNEYKNAHSKLWFQCLNLECNYEWMGDTHHIFNMGRGCPQCGGSLRLTNTEIDQRLIGKNIKRIDNYINAHTKIKFQCLKQDCNYIWNGIPDGICRGAAVCPECGIYVNQQLMISTLEKNNIIYEKNKHIKKLINIDCRFLVDCYLPYYNTIIEYNGHQHYMPVCFGGINKELAEENFELQKKRDLFVQKVCDEHHIKLIWIDGRKYTDIQLVNYILNEIIPSLIPIDLALK